MCDHSRHKKVPTKIESEPDTDPDSWQCERCTFSNSLLAARCHMCGVPLRRKSLNKSKSDFELKDSKDNKKRRKRQSPGSATAIESKKQRGLPKCSTKSCDIRVESGTGKCAYHAKLVNFREQIRYAKKHLNKSVVATLIQKRDKFRSKGNREESLMVNDPNLEE